MNNTLALLLSDGYKQVHAEQFPKGTNKLVSYMTPRKSRLRTQNKMVFFGLQPFCKKYLVDYFNENFFDVPLETVIKEYTHVLDSMLGKDNYDLRKVIRLHELGYLPISVWGLPEGTMVPMKVPCIEITNTHKDYAWVVQWVESLLSSEIWKPCIHAGVGFRYREIANKWYNKTVAPARSKDGVLVRPATPVDKAMSDFGFRGMSSLEEATKASAAWLLSFSGTATIPTIPFMERYYFCDNEEKQFATNAISTEHSVMASNFAVDGDERTMIKRLLTEIYPHASFSMVSDTYDYWNLVDNILPTLKDEIMAHDGKLLIRPDSGDIIEISVKTVEHLWGIFGGYVNEKGYKVLDPHIGVVYGDGVTPPRAETIYSELEKLGFAADNIVFGAGSFSFNCSLEEDENGNMIMGGYTRDTFCVAIKATAGEVNGKYVPIFKDPKTDRDNGDNFKKSQRGYCHIHYTEDGELVCKDGYDSSPANHDNRYGIVADEKYMANVDGEANLYNPQKDAMIPYFRNGKMWCRQSIYDIRTRLAKYHTEA